MSSDYIVYRLEPSSSIGFVPDGLAFAAFTNPLHGIRCFAALREQFGWAGAVKALLKLATKGRFFFALIKERRIASYVWTTEHASRYPTEAQSCVLGPMETRRDLRGRGLATALLLLSAAQLARHGYRAVYIDTAARNVASQRAIMRAGFLRRDITERSTKPSL